MTRIRLCRAADIPAIHRVINAAAEAYREVIPADQWHEPYMPLSTLERDIESGVVFCGCEDERELVGVMGVQNVRNVELIRHAYVLPTYQRSGIGASLIEHLLRNSGRPMLVGTWAAARWAISFYQRHGFVLVPSENAANLLRSYWTLSDRQVETSVVLANPPFSSEGR